jgi:hypothetical protein
MGDANCGSLPALERQARVFLGSLVLASTIVSFWSRGWGLGLTAFMGISLIFSGATGFCGTRRILARLPWNRRGR